MKILVVDDDAMAAEMVAAVLQELGHSAWCWPSTPCRPLNACRPSQRLRSL